MSTPTKIRNQLNYLIAQANSTTGGNATNVTAAVQDLIAGYGILIEETPENPDDPDSE